MKWVSIAEQLQTRLKCTMLRVGGSGVKYAAPGFGGNIYCGVMNHTSLCGSLKYESGYGEYQENIICLTALCQL